VGKPEGFALLDILCRVIAYAEQVPGFESRRKGALMQLTNSLEPVWKLRCGI